MSKTINISLPEDLVKKIDKLAKDEYASQSIVKLIAKRNEKTYKEL